ncbi:DUF4190 domain-containing protein [Leucobacter sp. W1153]|uniref:DUF4190 domain-containing protein n=1 Tax=unclassified Leucobacter TaxID=2621730 RepID=UPI003F32FE52
MTTPYDPNQQPATPQQPAAPQYAPPQQYAAPQQPANPPTNTMAIIALIASIIVSLVGVILGHIALSQIKKTGEGGRGLAIAALIIGYIGVAAWVVAIFVWIAIIASIGMSGVSY